MTIYELELGTGPIFKQFLLVEPPMTDAEIDELIDEADRKIQAMEKPKGFLLAIHGFDDDKRNLWEIPEALAFIDQLVARGMMSPLDCNLPLPPEKYDASACGAVQLWAWHKRLGGKFYFDRPLGEQFFADLSVSNQFIETRRNG